MNLNSKKILLNEAERLYVYKYLMVDELADRLHLNRKTIMAWKEEYDWDKKRKSYLKSKRAFHEELYEFARKLMECITADMEAGEKVDPGRMYAFWKIIPLFAKVKTYEDIVSKNETPEKPKGLSDELIAKIEEEVLGIKHNDCDTEEE